LTHAAAHFITKRRIDAMSNCWRGELRRRAGESWGFTQCSGNQRCYLQRTARSLPQVIASGATAWLTGNVWLEAEPTMTESI